MKKGKKEAGVHTKKEEAKERKENQKTEKKSQEEKVKEDSKWEDNDKKASKKAEKDVRYVWLEKLDKDRQDEKQRAKEEKAALIAAEEAELAKSIIYGYRREDCADRA